MPKRKNVSELERPQKFNKNYTNTSCPFNLSSLNELRKSGNLIVLKINNNSFFYDIQGLYDYIFEFSNFVDPFTRENFCFEHLDYILFKAYRKGIIKGNGSYNNKKLRTPNCKYNFDFCCNFYYINRVFSCLRENNKSYNHIKRLYNKYFCSTNKIDDFIGNYAFFPMVVSEDYYEKPLKLADIQFMKSDLHLYNTLDPISKTPLSNYDDYELMKIKEKSNWKNYHIETVYLELFVNLNLRNFTLEQIDFICFKYNEYLNILHCSDYIPDSPYNFYWDRFQMKDHGRYYKFKYMERINTFIFLLDEQIQLYDESVQSFLSNFWSKFYRKRNTSRPKYIPWNIDLN